MDARRRLFSSPSRTTMQAEALVILSSSPDFPSIDDILPTRGKKPLLRSGSRAAPIPETAPESFTTASSFWHSTIVAEDDSTGVNGGAAIQQKKERLGGNRPLSMPRGPVNCAKPAEAGLASFDRDATIATSQSPVQPKTRTVSRQPKSKAATKAGTSNKTVEEAGLPPKEEPWKRYNNNDATDGQTKISKGKMTKPTAAKPKPTRENAETVSRHFARPVASEPVEIHDDPIELEPALKRRTDWTPTKNTEPSVIMLDSSTTNDVASPRPSGADSSLQPHKDIFKDLRGTYSYPDTQNSSRDATSLEEPIEILGKRKLIEMVATSKPAVSKTPDASPVKQKAPKKKPRTITELATAAYRVVDITDDNGAGEQSSDASLLNYFPMNENLGSAPTTKDKAVTVKAKVSKPGAKAKTKRVSKKKAEPPQPILLSPESALRQVSRQDFVFGTSSQLATELDAGLLRDLQQAMRASNRQEENYDPFASSPVNSNVQRKASGNRLWGAGARDVDGDLLEVEVIDLVDSPAIEKDLTNPEVILSLAADAAKVRAGGHLESRSGTFFEEKDVITLSRSLTPAHSKPHISCTEKQSKPTDTGAMHTAGYSGAARQTSLQHVELDENPPASNQEQYHQMASSAPLVAPVPPEILVPKYELYTDAQLAKEVQSYGFKPIKRRTAAVALLQQCWTSKNQTKTLGQGHTASLSTSSSTAADIAKPSASAPTAPKPRGRPKKTASVTAAPEAPVVKRPRGRPKKEVAPGEPAATKRPSKAATNASALPQPAESAPGSMPGPSTPPRKRRAAAQPAIEIADSDDDIDPFGSSLSSTASSPAPPNEFSSPVPGVELSLTTEADDSVLSLTSSPTHQQARLFKYITDAVKTAPRSRDPSNPSWHEKMLMYDPIVIEDLTAWLNGGELDRVGCEDEVCTWDVKKWCESRSVCCLWKVNLNGKERKRF